MNLLQYTTYAVTKRKPDNIEAFQDANPDLCYTENFIFGFLLATA